MLQHKMY